MSYIVLPMTHFINLQLSNSVSISEFKNQPALSGAMYNGTHLSSTHLGWIQLALSITALKD